MKKKIVILGSGGMLGHVVALKCREYPSLYTVIDVARSNSNISPSILMDVTDFEALKKLIQEVEPDFIVNCVGVLNMNASNNPSGAILANSYLPHFLETITHNTSSKVIHISTDCVFSGRRGGYNETDFMDADGYYAKTKALGEIQNKKDLTIRTSIIGPELHTNGIGLFQWFSARSGSINGYTNVYWTGVTTIELANAIIKSFNEDLTGLYHLVNGIRISKFDLLNMFKEVFTKTEVGEIFSSQQQAYDKSLINTRTDFSYQVPNYLDMLYEMKQWIIDHIFIYPHYKELVIE